MPDITWTLPSGESALGSLSQTITAMSTITGVKQVAAGSTGTQTATSSLSATPLGNLTCSFIVSPRGNTAPSPGGGTGGTQQTYVKIGSATYLLTATNPTDTTYPGGRGVNQLIKYQSPVSTTVTNEWGCEVQVNSSNVVTAVNDRQATLDVTGTSVPSGGYVLSGHGTARDWLLTNATVSSTVSFVNAVNPDPVPDPTPNPSTGYPVKAISLYKMIWSNSDAAAVGSLPPACNVVRLAFAQGSETGGVSNPPSLVGYGPEGRTSLMSALTTWRAAGKKVVISCGGQGGAIDTSSRNTFLSGIATIKADLESGGAGLDGLDWDIEASSMNQSDVLFISTQLKAIYGSAFAITFVPNGGNVDQYLPAAVACHQAGALDEYGQQFYDANVSLSAAKGRIAQAIGAGIPESKMSVGMMIPGGGDNASNYWTNQQCRDYMIDIRTTWPGITKAYLWWAGRTGTAQWASDMGTVIGI